VVEIPETAITFLVPFPGPGEKFPLGHGFATVASLALRVPLVEFSPEKHPIRSDYEGGCGSELLIARAISSFVAVVNLRVDHERKRIFPHVAHFSFLIAFDK
jgi:hypothetical protein